MDQHIPKKSLGQHWLNDQVILSRIVDYSNPDVIAKISAKKPKDQKPHEKFVLKVTGQYGCADAYKLQDLMEYNPADFITGTDKVIDSSDPTY